MDGMYAGFGDMRPPVREVDVIPAQAQLLTLSCTGRDRQQYQQIEPVPVGCLTGFQEALAHGLGQEADPPLALRVLPDTRQGFSGKLS